MTEPVRPLKPQRRDTARLAATASSANPLADPAIASALQLKSFERSFDLEDLIGTLSDKQIVASKASTAAFDAKPFIKTFSPALDKLLALRKQVSEKTELLEDDVRTAEREYATRLQELDGGFETIGSSFSALETKITGVGRTAVRIGEQLESLHVSRELAQSTSILLSYYLSLAQPVAATPIKSPDGTEIITPTPLESLFATRTTREGRTRLAVVLRRLTNLAKDVREHLASALESLHDDDAGNGKGKGKAGKERIKLQAELEKAEHVQEEVDKYGERFEKECLRLFDRSYRKGDVRMMAHCAKILLDFNGGHSCVQIYVNQHDFFISKDRVLAEASEKENQGLEKPKGNERPVNWNELPDRDAMPPTSESGLTALFREIRVTVEQEAQIIQAVFPMKEEVMKVFLQRVFAQVIQQHLEGLFAKASSMSSLALLRMLRLTHAMCSALVEDLKQYDFTGSPPLPSVAHHKGGPVTALSTLLDQAMDEIFMPFLEGQRYVDLEIKNLSEGYQSLLSKFTRCHESVIKSKSSTLLDRVVNQLTTSTVAEKASAATTSSAASAASAAAAWLNKYSGQKEMTRGAGSASGTATPQRAPAAPSEEEKVLESDGVLSLPVAEQILRWHAEAIGRVVELSQAGDVSKNTLTLSKLLSDFIGRAYLELQLDSSLVKLDNSDSKAEPDLKPLAGLRQTDLILHLWQKYSSTALVPLTANAIAVRRQMANANTAVVSRLEAKVNAILQRTIESSMAYLAAQLTKQKRNDFKPKDDDLSFARNTTEACIACCEYIEKLSDAATTGLSGTNLETLLVEIGVGFHSLLLEHYKKFPVNPTGGLMLTKDLAAYQELFQSFSLSTSVLTDRFDMLRQLGNSFIVQPDVLKSYLAESYLGRIDMRLLRPYLMQRSDWPSFARQFDISEDDAIGTEGASSSQPSSGAHSTAKGILRSSRLGMGVGTGGMSRLKDMLKDMDTYAFGDEPSHKQEPQASPRTQAQQKLTGQRYPTSSAFVLPIH